MSVIADILNDPVIFPLGSALLGTHIALYVIFKYVCKDGPWKELPSFTAHQVVALAMMIYTSYLGFTNYNNRGMLHVDEGGLYLSRLSMGAMMLWDIPVGLLSDGMGDPIMHCHHIGFFIVATIALGFYSGGVSLGSAYAPFFFGVIELSSIPLTIVDVFHPKQKAWHTYLSTSKTLEAINELSRVLFAVFYMITRMIYFPYVVATGVVPDSLATIKEHPEFAGPLWAIVVLAVLFTFLQLYWGTLIIRQIVKALSGDGGLEIKKKKE